MSSVLNCNSCVVGSTRLDSKLLRNAYKKKTFTATLEIFAMYLNFHSNAQNVCNTHVIILEEEMCAACLLYIPYISTVIFVLYLSL